MKAKTKKKVRKAVEHERYRCYLIAERYRLRLLSEGQGECSNMILENIVRQISRPAFNEAIED